MTGAWVQDKSKERLVVAIDGRKRLPESRLPRLGVVVKGEMEGMGLDLAGWVEKVEELGAGEILLTSKETDGTKDGYALEMTQAIAEAVDIPVTASVFHFGEISIPQAKP